MMMAKNKEFRELQFSSTQLVFVFLAILVLGVFIFLLGMSVGKKQGQLSAEAGVSGALKTEPIAQKPAVPSVSGTDDIQQELRSHQEAKPQSRKSEAKQAPADQKTSLKTETPPARDKVAEFKPPTDAKKPAESKAKAEMDKRTAKAVESKKPGLFLVQVGAFGDKEAASAFAKRLEKEGYAALVADPLPADKKSVFRVRVGPFESKEDADASRTKLAALLKKKKTDFFIIR